MSKTKEISFYYYPKSMQKGDFINLGDDTYPSLRKCGYRVVRVEESPIRKAVVRRVNRREALRLWLRFLDTWNKLWVVWAIGMIIFCVAGFVYTVWYL